MNPIVFGIIIVLVALGMYFLPDELYAIGIKNKRSKRVAKIFMVLMLLFLGLVCVFVILFKS